MHDPLMSSNRFVARVLHLNLQSLQRLFWRISAPPAFQAEPIALLIDGENVSSEFAVYMLAAAGKFGGVTVRRVYGNWTQASMKPWQVVAAHYNILTIHYQPPISGKNATDIKLVVDAMELWHDGMRRFCLVSSDSDYTPLVQRLSELGCFVLGIGKAETPSMLRQACTVFLPLEHLFPPSLSSSPSKVVNLPIPAPSQAIIPPPRKIVEVAPSLQKVAEAPLTEQEENRETSLQKLLVQAYRQVALEEGKDWVPLAKFGNMLKQFDSTFKVKDHGSASLKALVQKHMNVFEMQKREGGHPAIRIKPELEKKKKS